MWVPVTSGYYTAMIAAWRLAMRNLPGAERYALAGPNTGAWTEFWIWTQICWQPRTCPSAFKDEVDTLYWKGQGAEAALALALSGGGVNRGEAGGDPLLGGLEGDLATVQREDGGVIIGDGLSCGASFAPGTRVLLATGKTIPIASLKPGDKVLATNTRTGKTSPETVTAVEVHHDTDLYNLNVKTTHGTEVIHTTSNHLFWDPYLHYGWIPANHLKPGMHLKTPDGQSAVVVGGSVPAVHDGWMWDLTVPGNNDHDFYVVVTTLRSSSTTPVESVTPDR